MRAAGPRPLRDPRRVRRPALRSRGPVRLPRIGEPGDMVKPRRRRWSLGILLLSCVASAEGYQGTGRITLMPSARLTNQDPFYDSASVLGYTRAPGISGGPGIFGDFGYAAAETFEVTISPFFATEELH